MGANTYYTAVIH